MTILAKSHWPLTKIQQIGELYFLHGQQSVSHTICGHNYYDNIIVNDKLHKYKVFRGKFMYTDK